MLAVQRQLDSVTADTFSSIEQLVDRYPEIAVRIGRLKAHWPKVVEFALQARRDIDDVPTGDDLERSVGTIHEWHETAIFA